MADKPINPRVRNEAELVDALNKAHDQAKALAETLKEIRGYLRITESGDQADEFHSHWASALDIADDSLEFAQWIENRD